jgi:tripartite-type tricarboxylate transporter receptor subunit TctC
LLASYNSSIAPGPLMYAKIPYDPIKDFQHIALIGVYPQYLIVRADHPAKSIQDFLATVRTKPGTVNYASAGVGTGGHLSGELFKMLAQIETKLEELGKVQARPQQDSAAALKSSADRLDAQSKDLRALQEELGRVRSELVALRGAVDRAPAQVQQGIPAYRKQ